MRFLKHLLFPIQIVYSLIIIIRNKLYDLRIISSYDAKPITISVGNIKNGGTGKTPMVEYLINLLENKKIGVLSRGYKRKTKGFILANKHHTSKDIGDENCQLYNKYQHIIIAADNNRVNGIKEIFNIDSSLEIIILDDAFQHRSLNRDIDIVLTEYNDLFVNDQLMPIGQLREHKQQMKRANIIVVTKCPKNISQDLRKDTINKLKPHIHQKVYFSYIKEYKYIDMSLSQEIQLNRNEKHILITGIANANPLLDFLNKNQIIYSHMQFHDHYNFQTSDIDAAMIMKEENNMSDNLLLTEKDYYRLDLIDKKTLTSAFNIVCVKIEIDFIESDKSNFNNQLLKFEKNKTIK